MINSITGEADGTIWVATMNGLNFYKPEENKWHTFLPNGDIKDKSDLPNNLVWDIRFDKDGLLWIASDVFEFSSYNTKTKQFTYYDWPAFVKTLTVNPTRYASIQKFARRSPKEFCLGTTKGLSPFAIVGVIKDIHFSSLKEKIVPEVYTMDSAFSYGQIRVKINAGNMARAVSLLEDVFKKLAPYYPYSYQFMDDINAHYCEAEMRWKKIITIASALFAFISCIGLFGLVMLSVVQRIKGIGIRKVQGAAVTSIVRLIIGQIMLTGLFTMGIKAIAAAFTNPVKSLRAE